MNKKTSAAFAGIGLVLGLGLSQFGTDSAGDYTYHTFASTGPIAANSFDAATAVCPVGTQVVSGGFQNIDPGHVDVVMSSNGPGDPPTTWRVEVRNRSSVQANETIAYVICVASE